MSDYITNIPEEDYPEDGTAPEESFDFQQTQQTLPFQQEEEEEGSTTEEDEFFYARIAQEKERDLLQQELLLETQVEEILPPPATFQEQPVYDPVDTMAIRERYWLLATRKFQEGDEEAKTLSEMLMNSDVDGLAEAEIILNNYIDQYTNEWDIRRDIYIELVGWLWEMRNAIENMLNRIQDRERQDHIGFLTAADHCIMQ